MKKIFITMLATVAATASFAQNPNIGKEIKATKDYKAGLEIYKSQEASLAPAEKAKAWAELYKLAKPAADKSFAAVIAQKTDEVNYNDIYNAIYAAKNFKDNDEKKGTAAMTEMENYRAILINASNETNDNQEKLNYSKIYLATAKDGDPFVSLASFFAAYASYQNKDYKNAQAYAKGALKLLTKKLG